MSVCPNPKFINSRPSTRPIVHTRPLTTTAAVNCLNSNRVSSRAASGAAMANSARVAVAQMTSINDLAANFATCSRLVKEAAAAGAKMLFFPESFSFVAAEDGESLKIAETLDGPIMKQYCSLARDSGIWLSLGGFQEKGSDDSHLCNTRVIVDDSGSARSKYRKIHPFDVDVPGGMVYKESSFTEAGEDIVALDTPVGRLGLTVCYDLRFPEIYEQLRFHHQARVLLGPSAFTKITGQAHWEILLVLLKHSVMYAIEFILIARKESGFYRPQERVFFPSVSIRNDICSVHCCGTSWKT